MNDFFEPNGPLFNETPPKFATRTSPSRDADTDHSVMKIRRTEFAKRLYSLMISKNWNQSDLARAANLGRDSVSNYIRANNTPSPRNLKKLADALNVEPVALYPNYGAAALEEEMPILSFRQMPSDEGHMWVRINKKVPKAVAAKIMLLLNE